MKKLAVDLNIDLRRVIAVGDGANDIPMISNSGLGIAFRAKPKVSEASKYAIKIGGLDTILYFLGIKDDQVNSFLILIYNGLVLFDDILKYFDKAWR